MTFRNFSKFLMYSSTFTCRLLSGYVKVDGEIINRLIHHRFITAFRNIKLNTAASAYQNFEGIYCP